MMSLSVVVTLLFGPMDSVDLVTSQVVQLGQGVSEMNKPHMDPRGRRWKFRLLRSSPDPYDGRNSCDDVLAAARELAVSPSSTSWKKPRCMNIGFADWYDFDPGNTSFSLPEWYDSRAHANFRAHSAAINFAASLGRVARVDQVWYFDLDVFYTGQYVHFFQTWSTGHLDKADLVASPHLAAGKLALIAANACNDSMVCGDLLSSKHRIGRIAKAILTVARFSRRLLKAVARSVSPPDGLSGVFVETLVPTVCVREFGMDGCHVESVSARDAPCFAGEMYCCCCSPDKRFSQEEVALLVESASSATSSPKNATSDSASPWRFEPDRLYHPVKLLRH